METRATEFHYIQCMSVVNSEPLILIDQISKTYTATQRTQAAKVLHGISFQVQPKEFVAITGPSGSGKTTLLNIMAGLDRPTEGEVFILGSALSGLSRMQLGLMRRHLMSMIFQAYNLFPVLRVVENVEYTCLIRGDSKNDARQAALAALESVHLSDHINKFPNQLSGGQQQRVAVARALATASKIIFADEPTANLDSKSASSLIELFRELNRSRGISFIFSTHDPRVVGSVDRQIEMNDGKIVRDERL